MFGRNLTRTVFLRQPSSPRVSIALDEFSPETAGVQQPL